MIHQCGKNTKNNTARTLLLLQQLVNFLSELVVEFGRSFGLLAPEGEEEETAEKLHLASTFSVVFPTSFWVSDVVFPTSFCRNNTFLLLPFIDQQNNNIAYQCGRSEQSVNEKRCYKLVPASKQWEN